MKKSLHIDKKIPLHEGYDVIVLGGGTAGALAGIAAARRGCKTLIIEQFGALGGSATLGLVTPLMSSHLKNDRGHCKLSHEIVERMCQLGGTQDNDYYFDPTLLKIVLEDMVLDSGCELLYHTMLSDSVCLNGKIAQVIVSNKDGLCAYSARYFVDATGDADLAYFSGISFESGNDEGINQPVSLRFEMAGIDFDKFHKQMQSLGSNQLKYFAMNTKGIKELLQKAKDDGVLTQQDIKYFQAFGLPGRPDALNFNCPELTTDMGIANAKFITQKQIEGKKAILRLRTFLRTYIHGFETAYITEIAPFVGFRESRRINAEYVMTINDILSYQKFEDAIASSCYPLDVHGVEDVTLGLKYDETVVSDERYWQVPYRSMVAKEVSNLLVTGRCAGFDFRAQSATRVQIICRCMGEAAGISCALACKKHSSFAQVDGCVVSKEMNLATV